MENIYSENAIEIKKTKCSISNMNLVCHSCTKSSFSTNYPRPFISLKKIQSEQKINWVPSKTVKIEKDILNDIVVIGQVWNKVLIVFNKNNGRILVIDQHAVHERIRYEYYSSYLKSTFFNQKVYEKHLSFDPSIIKIKELYGSSVFKKDFLHDEDQDLLFPTKWLKFIDILAKYGIEFNQISEIEDNILIKVRTVPCILGYKFEKDIIFHICQFYENITNEKETSSITILDDQDSRIPSQIDELLMSKSCKNAIKFNDKLDNKTSQQLLLQLLYCDHPLYCVHGRNSIYPLHDFKSVFSFLKQKKQKRNFVVNNSKIEQRQAK